MPGLGLLLVLIGMLLVTGAWERSRHRRALAQVPVRVHINGTRGKSSVTRLVAAGLRAGGVRTCAKTTGTLARMIMPDGRERTIFRPAAANVREQIRVVRTAANAGAEVLVVECMALQPSLQWLCEAEFIRATHAVITNARPDHLDVMGPTADDVTWAMAGMIAPARPLYTAERERLAIIETAAGDRGATVVAIGTADVAAISPADLDGFGYLEHPDNLALALRICGDLGVEREVALRGMWAATPDPGAATEFVVRLGGRTVVFFNAFAANDPQSTAELWQGAIDRHPELPAHIVALNCRKDRKDRTLQFAELCAGWDASHIVLLGTGTEVFRKAYAGGAVLDEAGVDLEGALERLLGQAPAALVVGVGNIGGPGLDIVQRFHRRQDTQERVGTAPPRPEAG